MLQASQRSEAIGRFQLLLIDLRELAEEGIKIGNYSFVANKILRTIAISIQRLNREF